MRGLLCFILAATAAFAQDKEVALGKRLLAELERQYKPLADPEVTVYTASLVERLTRVAAPHLPVLLKLFETPDPVASALPGGVLVLSAGAIRCAGSEAELAALLAHQIGHVQISRPHQGSARRAPVPLLAGPAGLCQRSSGSWAPMALEGTLAADEQRADELALDWLAEAGYDPQALPLAFDRCSSRAVTLAIRERTGALAPANAVLNTSAFDRIHARLAPPSAARRRPPSLYGR